MSLLGIFYQNDYVTLDDPASGGKKGLLGAVVKAVKQQLGFTSGILIDATISENHNLSSEVSENPIEDGSVIADHINLKPRVFTLEGVLTDTPLGLPVVSSFVNLANKIGEVFGKNSHSINAMNSIIKLRDKRIPFNVTSHLTRYENMVFEKIDFVFDQTTGDAIKFSATLKQIKIVKSKSSANPLAKFAGLVAKKTDFGQQVTSPVSAGNQATTQAGSKGSFLYSLVH